MICLRTIRMRAHHGLAMLALGLFVLTLSASAAMAQAIDDAGAAVLKADIERALDRRTAGYNAQHDGGAIQRDGELTVTPMSGYYAIVLPHLSIKSDEGDTMDIGVIKLNAIPAGQDKYRVTMAIPTPLTGFDATGVPRTTFSIGRQKFSGIWHSKYDTYLESDLDYGDLRLDINDPNGKLSLTVGDIAGKMKLDDQGNDKFSGPYNFTVEDIRFTGGNDSAAQPKGVDGSIARIEARGMMVNADLKKAADFQESMESRMEGLQGTPQTDIPPEVSKQVFSELMNYMTGFADDFDMAFNAHGVDLTITDPAQPGPTHVQLDKAGFGMKMDGMDRNALNLTVNYGIESVNILPAPPGAGNYLPFSLVFNLATENLPHKALSTLLTDEVSASIDAQNGQGTGMQPGQAMMDVKNTLGQAGTVLHLDGTHFNAGDLDARINGAISARATAVMGAVIDLNLVLKGVDKAIAALSQPGTPPEVMQQGMQVLGMLQAFGRPQQGNDGATELVYNLKLTEDGQATLNGKPLPVPGMGGGMGGPGMDGQQPMPLP